MSGMGRGSKIAPHVKLQVCWVHLLTPFLRAVLVCTDFWEQESWVIIAHLHNLTERTSLALLQGSGRNNSVILSRS